MPISSAPNFRWLILLMLMGFTALGHFNRTSMSVVGSERLIDKSKKALDKSNAAAPSSDQTEDDPDDGSLDSSKDGSEIPGRGQGLSEEQMGYVYSAFLMVYTLLMLPGGWLIDRIGPTAALTWMGLGMGSCVVLTGVVGWLGLTGQTLWLALLAIRGLAGASCVTLHPGAARSVSLWMPPGSRSTGNGLVTAGALLGIALSYPAFGRLMDWLDWPLACVVSGAAMILLAIVWRMTASDHPASNAVNGNLQLIANTGASGDRRSSPIAPLHELLAFLTDRSFVLVTVSYSAVSYFQYLFFYWIGYYFEQVQKLPPIESRNAAFVVMLAMAVGMAVGGLCTDLLCRWCGFRWGRRLLAMASMGLCAGFTLVGLGSESPEMVKWWFALALGSLGICEGIFWTAANDLGGSKGGLAGSFINTSGNAVGLLAPIFSPMLARLFDWNVALQVACGVCVFGGLLWLWIDPQRTVPAGLEVPAGT
ncbi:MAG: MFS transporter [Planctomycetales bacterium]